MRFRSPGQPGPEHEDAPGTPRAPSESWEVCRRLTEPHQTCRAATTPDYLEEFRARFEDLVEHLETGLTADLEARGPSEDLMHDWSLLVAQAQDFLAALGAEIARAER
ncbi:MAG: hypothetical protein MI824_11435 [Hyphomicrobiales bacterium]|nr:hypothetical protein [Hyphomicrobiales bacterium]